MSRHGPIRRFFRRWKGKPGFIPWLNYQPIRLLLFIGRRLPERALYAVVGSLGRLSWLSERRRTVGRLHIAQAFPELEAKDRDRILKKSCWSLGVMGAEGMLMAPRMHGGEMERRLKTDEGTDDLLREVSKGPAIIVQAHLGSFELGAVALSIFGIRAAFPMRMPNNWYLGQRLLAARSEWDVKILQRQGAVRHMMRHLKEGNQVVLAADQSAHHNPIEVPWFGRPAPTERAVAALALKTGVPVVVSWCYRPEPGGDWLLGARLVEEGGASRAADDEALTDLLSRIHTELEEAIKRRPEQYLWIHDRYRSQT